MSFDKSFRFTMREGLVLNNTSERDAFLKDKIQHFSKYKNYSNKEDQLKFLQEIIDMNNHDMATAKFDFQGFDNMVGFNLEQEKEIMIYFYNLVIMLGAVFFNVFDRKGNRLISLVEGQVLPYKTTDMFGEGYNQLVFVKQNDIQNAFGATLIFITLFEKDIKTYIKLVYIDELLNELENQIAQGNVSLSEDDEDLYFYLRFQYEKDTENKAQKTYENRYTTTELAYKLFESNGIITDDKKFFKGIFEVQRMTLNNLITEQKFKNKIDARFIEIIDILFSPQKLNLRNNLAHANNGFQNYFNINVTALLYGLYMMLSSEMILK